MPEAIWANGESLTSANNLRPPVLVNLSRGADAAKLTGTPLFHLAMAVYASVIVTSSAHIELKLAEASNPTVKKLVPE